jgi:ribA/ribD-fused uncharacterized protein
MEIRFYRACDPYGFLSNLFAEAVEFEGRVFPCAEYAYQFGKPNKVNVAEWLMAAPTPSLCAQAAHALFGWQIRSDWAQIKVERMRDVLRAKFTQHEYLRKQLLATGDAELIEESTMDAFWGIGKKGNGQNMLGKLLMEVRAELKTPETR